MARLVISRPSDRKNFRPGMVISIYDWGPCVVYENTSSGIVRVRRKNGKTEQFTPKYFTKPVACEILEDHDPIVYKNSSYYFKGSIQENTNLCTLCPRICGGIFIDKNMIYDIIIPI